VAVKRRRGSRKAGKRDLRDDRTRSSRVGGGFDGLTAPKTSSRRPIDLGDPSLYLDRELSLLAFQERVLAQARDAATPLLERLRFLTICSTNLDEFFEIRVAGLKQQEAVGIVRSGPDGPSPQELLARIGEAAHRLVAEQYRVLNDELLPALAKERVRLVRVADWTPRQARWVRRYFRSQVAPVLTPVGLDPGHPFPRVLNKGLDFIVSLEGDDAFGRRSGIAVLQVPRALPRLLVLPPKVADGPHDFVMITSVIRAHAGELFPGMEVKGAWQFRVTRNSDLWVDEDEAEDLLQAVKGELPARQFGAAVRLEVADDCTPEVSAFLLDMTELGQGDLYVCPGPVNLYRLVALHELCDRPDLKYRPFVPGVPRRIEKGRGMFDAIRRRDLLLHHPYESFTPVIDLIREAAADPNVLAIKQTLYRVGAHAPLVDALLEAARVGKEVTVLVELRARFEEAANIDLATKLQEAGANVVYGIVRYKAHAKALLVVRREGKRLRRYVHLGTGNYHAGTTRAYTDFGLMTCDKEIGEDVHRLFSHLTGLGGATRMRRLLESPFTLHKALLDLIDRETGAARRGKRAEIVARMNALEEPTIIRALYEASRAGVKIDLLVRGICRLRPGVPGVSENIRVRSIVGRFLEHSRVFRFHARGAELVFLASADWMTRNLHHRVETCFPVDDARLKARVVHEGLDTCLADNVQAWTLHADGSWRRLKPGKRPPRCAQEELLHRLAATADAPIAGAALPAGAGKRGKS
jgi:polyphosphate kinase